jgi:hypothetical protein
LVAFIRCAFGALLLLAFIAPAAANRQGPRGARRLSRRRPSTMAAFWTPRRRAEALGTFAQLTTPLTWVCAAALLILAALAAPFLAGFLGAAEIKRRSDEVWEGIKSKDVDAAFRTLD